jgi:murein DD-endopeptidase MepM/ murein hydrolase activator NlpD
MMAFIALISASETPTLSHITPPAPAPAPIASEPTPTPVPAEPLHGLAVRALADGQPVADAEVTVSDGSGMLRSARTDREGVAHFDVAAGPHELWATADALASPIARTSEADAPIELVLEPAASVHGHAIADDALPAGGSIQLVPLDVDHAVRTVALDEHGAFAIAGLPLGRWRVEPKVPGYALPGEQIAHVDGRSAAIDVHLVKAATASGTVVDSTGSPVANATIVLTEQTGTLAMPRSLDLSATGLRWLHPLAGARKVPAIDDARFGASRPGPRPAECGRGHCGIDLGNERGSVVHAAADGEIASLFPDGKTEAGRVVVIHHGRGLKSYYMHLDEIRAGLEVGQAIHAGDPVGTLGSTGFSRPLPHLHFALTYEAGGRTWYLDPEPIIRQAVVLAAPRAYGPVEVAVTPGSLPGMPTLQRVTTDANGVFHVDGLIPGTYAVGAFASDFAPGASAPFAAKSGEETTGIIVALTAGMLVEGRVMGREGPIAGATLIASAGFGETAHKVAMTSTDRHGEFALRAVGGKVTVTVSAAGYGDIERTLALDDPRAHHREDFALVIEDAELRGQVFAPDGGAAAGAVVRVVEGPTRRATVADARGQFTLGHVASGRYVLELSSAEAPAKRVTVDSDRWAEVRLEAGGGVRCAIRDAQTGAPIASARIDLVGPGATVHRTSDARGFVELHGLATGEWRISARAAGYAVASHDVAIRVSRAPDEVTLDLVRGASIEGVVRDRYGRRVAGARVSLGGASAIADHDGNFRLADVPAGAGVVEAEAEGRRGAQTVQLAPGDARVGIDVQLSGP